MVYLDHKERRLNNKYKHLRRVREGCSLWLRAGKRVRVNLELSTTPCPKIVMKPIPMCSCCHARTHSYSVMKDTERWVAHTSHKLLFGSDEIITNRC